MSGSTSNSRPRHSIITAISTRTVALAMVLAGGAFIAIGAIFDLATDAAGNLPGDHGGTFKAVTGTTWQQASSAAHTVTPYVTRAEAGYAAFELLFGCCSLWSRRFRCAVASAGRGGVRGRSSWRSRPSPRCSDLTTPPT